MFPDIPPIKAPPVLVRPAEELLKLPVVDAPRHREDRSDAQRLAHELFEPPRVYLTKMVGISAHGLRAAEDDLSSARSELASLTIFEYFSEHRAAMVRQVRLDETRKSFFSGQIAHYSGMLEALQRVERAVTEGRLAGDERACIRMIHRGTSWRASLDEVLERASKIAELAGRDR